MSEQLPNNPNVSMGDVVGAVGPLVTGAAVESSGQFDHLFDPDRFNGMTDAEIVEAAAISTVGSNRTLPPARTSDRVGYWKKPTEGQIAAAAARKDGTDLSKQLKYYL